MTTPTITASEFKAKCLDLLDQLAARKLARLAITKRGRIVAIVVPPDDTHDIDDLHGFMQGSIIAPEGCDFTIPVLDEPLDADEGRFDE